MPAASPEAVPRTPFLIAVEADGNPGHPTFAVIEPVQVFDNVSLRDRVEQRLATETEAC